jgi:hypothetical protein
MKILGALVLCLCLPGLAFAQRSGAAFGSGGTSTLTSGGGGGGGAAGGGEVNGSMMHTPATHFKYPAGHNDGGYVPSGFVPFSQAVASAKPAPGEGTYMPFEKAVEAGREANEPMPSLGEFAREERARREHKPVTK